MGTIPDSAARLIRDQTGVEVSGYTAILPGSSVQHIFKNHGDTQKEATRGQRAVSAEDIAQIPKVLASPDAVTLSEDTDVFGRPVLLFSKQIGDTYITAQAVTDGRHMLATNTLWIQKKKNPLVTESNAAKRDPAHNAQSVPPSGSSFESTPSEMNADETAPVPTSKTPEPVLPTAPIIADSSAKGNTQYAQNSVGQTGAIPAAERVQANGFDTPSTLSDTELRSAFGENGAAAYRLGWRGGMDETDYYMAFSHAYNAGAAGRSLDSLKDRTLTDAQRGAAFESGRSDADAAARKAGFATVYGTDSGLVWDEHTRAMDQKAAGQVNEVARRLGVRVLFADRVAGAAANAQIENGVITIAKDAQNPVRAVFGHEITHRIQELAPEEYRAFREAAMADTEFLDQQVEGTRALYAKGGQELTSLAAMDELAADYAGRLMEDEGAVRQGRAGTDQLGRAFF